MVLLLFLSSCKNEDEKNIMKKELFPNGKLKSEITYINDTVKEGKAIYYYESGSVGRVCFYKKNKVDSLYIEYYPDGMVKKKGMYHLGNPLGSFFYYYSNGKLETYNTNDYANDAFYVVKFDLRGNKVYEDGIVVSPTVASPTHKQQYAQGDSIALQYLIAEPPGYKAKVLIGVYKYSRGEDRLLIDRFKEYQLNAWSQVIYKSQFNDTGHYRVVCVGHLIDTVKGFEKIDTASNDFFIVAD